MLPEYGVEVITFAKDRALAYVEGLGNGVQMKETSGELQVGVRDVPAQVFIGDETACDELRPLEAPEHWHVRLVTGAWLQFDAWEPHPPPAPFPGVSW